MSMPFKFDCNIAQLVQMMDSKRISYEGAIQRGYVWDNKRKSRLIRSILLDRAIGMFNYNQIKKNTYEGLDGKQRSNAINEFIKGNYKLHVSTQAVYDENGDKIEIAKRGYKDLPEFLQNKINSYGLIIYCYNNLSVEEKIEIFMDINNGKPVSATEITRINVKSRDVFQELTKHRLIDNVLTATGKKKNIGEDIIEQIWIICYSDSKSLLNKDVAPILNTVEVTEKQKNELLNILDYLAALLTKAGSNKKISRKLKAKTHLVSLAYMAMQAIRNGISDAEYAEKAIKFFTCEGNKATTSDEYNKAVGSGSAKQEQVQIRMKEVEKALE